MLKKISSVLIKCISKNFGWKLFSVVCAVIVWFIVMNILNPTEIQTYSVNVTFVNEDKLTEKGLVVINKDEIQNTKIDIKVKSTRAALEELTKNKKDIAAAIDLKQFSMLYAGDIAEPFKVAVNPSIPTSYVYTYELVSFTPPEISIKLDRIVETEKEIIVDSEGEMSNGYLAGETVVMPSAVTVKGASEEINKIDSVKVFLDMNDVSEGFVKDFTPKAYDSAGNEVSTVIIEPDTVQVSLGVYKYGQIPVKEPKIEGSAGEGYEISKIEWEPKYIEVVGDKDEIARVGEITPSIRIDGETDATIVRKFDVNAHIAKNKLSIKSGTQKEVTVTLTLVKIEEQEITINNENVTFEDAGDEREFSLTEPIKIKIKGTSENISKMLAENNIKATIKASGLPDGISSAEVSVVLPEGISLSEDVFAKVEVKRKVAEITTIPPSENEISEENNEVSEQET